MSEFDWSQDIKPDHRNGAGISAEEFYQACIERMQKEGRINPVNRVERCGGQCLRNGQCLAEHQGGICCVDNIGSRKYE